MSVIGNIWSQFSGAPKEPTTVVVQAAPAGDPAAATPTPEPAPLDDMAKWFTPAEGDVKPQQFDPSKLIDQSPEAQAQLATAIGELNFMQGVATPEALAKLEAGGPEAVQVTMAMMNKMAQGVFQAATQAAVKINETSFSKASPQIDNRVAAILQSRQTTEAIKEASPVLNHPAAAFMVDTLAEKFQAKYPTATKSEITQMAKDFVTQFSSAATPKAEPVKGTETTDWMKFFNERP